MTCAAGAATRVHTTKAKEADFCQFGLVKLSYRLDLKLESNVLTDPLTCILGCFDSSQTALPCWSRLQVPGPTLKRRQRRSCPGFFWKLSSFKHKVQSCMPSSSRNCKLPFADMGMIILCLKVSRLAATNDILLIKELCCADEVLTQRLQSLPWPLLWFGNTLRRCKLPIRLPW